MKSILSAVIGATLALSAIEAHAQVAAGERQVVFVIESKTLAEALDEWAKQTGFSLFSPDWEIARKLTAPTLKGTFGVQRALDRLLEGSPLTYEWIDSRTVTVRARFDKAVLQKERGATPIPLQFAQVSDGPPAGAGRGGAASDTGVGSARDNSASSGKLTIPEILVEGSRLLNMDVERTADDVQPYVVFDRKKIERSTAKNLEDFLKQQLTMGTTSTTLAQGNSPQGSVSSINLRGFGPDETLILIDGHRTAAYGFNGSPQQPDLNGIPLAAVERIEVLAASASGIYGGSATGGVINVILKRDYNGLDVKLTYGDTFSGGAASQAADVTAGFNLEDGKTNILLAGSYAKQDPLLMRDRDVFERGRARILANNPTALLNGFIPPLGGTTNVMSDFVFDPSTFQLVQPMLTLRDGTPLNATTTSVPVGYAGPDSDAGAGLTANAGHYNLGLGPTAQRGGGRQPLYQGNELESFIGTIRREFTPNISLFLDVRASNSTTTAPAGVFPLPYNLSALDPANPFQQNIVVTTPATNADGTLTASIYTRHAQLGTVIRLPKDWQSSIDFTWERTRFANSSPSRLDFAASGAAVRSGAVDVFSDTGKDFSSVLLRPATTEPAYTTLKDATVRAAGPIGLSLPGGDIVLASLLEHRDENFGEFRSVFPLTADLDTIFVSPSRSQKVDSLYMEATFPFISENNAVTGARLLELQVAGRRDEYRLEGSNQYTLPFDEPTVLRSKTKLSSTDPTVGLRYRPVEHVMIRGSYSTGFLPPALNELVTAVPITFAAPEAAFTFLTDPLRGDEPFGFTSVTFTSGGNPDLRPEEAKTWSAGLVLTPSFVPGLRMSVDWVRIEKTDNIVNLTAQVQSDLNRLIEFRPDRITREAPEPGDPFGVGRIIAINDTAMNISRARSEAYDVSLDYALDTVGLGRFSFGVSGTRQVHFERQFARGAEFEETAGVGSGPLKWKASGSLGWEYGPLTLAWTTRYYADYWLFDDHSVDLNQGSASIPSQVYHDFFAGY